MRLYDYEEYKNLRVCDRCSGEVHKDERYKCCVCKNKVCIGCGHIYCEGCEDLICVDCAKTQKKM
jgi:hypothetical protein